MTKDILIKPYTDYLFVEPTKIETVIGDAGLTTFGKVIATGPEVKNTKVGDFVAFEMWDLKDFTKDEKVYRFVREREAICQVEL